MSAASAAMSTGLARNWWAVGLRAIAAVLFGLSVLILPPSTIAALMLLFASYIAADGIFAILAGARAPHRGERWWTLICEGLANLSVAGTVLVWPAIMVYPVVNVATAWAVVTGALMLTAARRLSGSDGRWPLAFAGIVSVTWGILASAVGPSFEGRPRTMALWLVAYALPFGITLLVLTLLLKRRHR